MFLISKSCSCQEKNKPGERELIARFYESWVEIVPFFESGEERGVIEMTLKNLLLCLAKDIL